LLVLTEHALDSPHVLREVERTSSKRLPIIALRIGVVSLPPALEYFLSGSHWLETDGTAVRAVLPPLIAAVRRIIERTPDGADAPENGGTPSARTPPKVGWTRRSRYFGLAYCYAMRDDKDQAFTWLNRAYDRHDLHLQFMNEDPALRTLHSYPCFAVLAGKIAAAQ
jgi:hypothetical protein